MPLAQEKVASVKSDVSDELGDPWADDPGAHLRPVPLENLAPDLAPPQSEDDLLTLDHRTSDSYLWANPPPDDSQFSVLNMPVYASDNDCIISVERLASLLEFIECEAQHIASALQKQ
ncbi:hypothetical protein VTO42DRAFT_5403 [Malbranchea cinnamomea]